MKILRDVIILVFAATFVVGATVWAGAADSLSEDAELTRVAEQGMYAFLEIIPRIQQEDGEFGFAKTDSLDKVYIGIPYKLHKINSQALSDYQEGDTVSSLISETQMWYFPIMLADQMKAVLIVDKVKGKWKAVGFGCANLSAKLEKVRRNWPASEGYNPLLISFQEKEYLYTIPEKGAYHLTSLTFQEAEEGGTYSEKGGTDFSDRKKLSKMVERLNSFSEKNLTEQTKSVVSKRARSTRAYTGPMGMASLYLGSYVQEMSGWCWNACSQAMIEHYGIYLQDPVLTTPQQIIAEYAKPGMGNEGNRLDPDYSDKKCVHTIVEYYTGLSATYHSSNISPSDAWQEISVEQDPFIVRWLYSTNGHEVVAYAYVYVDPNMCAFCPNPNEPMLAIMNPSTGDRTLYGYTWIVNGDGHTWNQTLTID